MSAARAIAVTTRLESRAKAAVTAYAARTRSLEDAAMTYAAATHEVTQQMRRFPRWSSFTCATMAQYLGHCGLRIASLQTEAVAVSDQERAARDEQRLWAGLRRGLQRRAARRETQRCRS